MIEIIGAIILLISVFLLAKKKNIGWIFGIIGNILYSIVFFETKLYADFGLQFIFVFQSFYAIYIWNKFKVDDDKILKETQVSTLSNKYRIISLVSIIITGLVTGYLLDNYTDANLPYVDGMVASISIIANWLLSIRKIESWILWIIADIIFITMFIQTELYVTLGLYVIFLINAIYGYINWKKKLKLCLKNM